MTGWRKAVLGVLLCALAGCASTADLRQAYRTGYVDGVRDTVTVIRRSRKRLLARAVYRKVTVPDSLVGGTYVPAHEEVILSPAGVEYAFTPAEADELGRAFVGLDGGRREGKEEGR